MQGVFREIRSLRTEHFRLQKHLDFPAHLHDDIELVYIRKGGGTAYCDGKKYTLEENMFFVAFPNQVHHYSGCPEGEYPMLIAKPSVLLGYRELFEQGVPASAVWQFEEHGDDGAVYLMEQAMEEFAKEGQSVLVEAYLTALFGKLFRVWQLEKNRGSGDMVLRIQQYCAAHYRENISVESVAQALHISRSSVSHIFSTRLAINFCDYINSLRLSDAVRMLNSESCSMTEIADTCGFSTIRTFNRAFLKRYGVSPTAYRKAAE